MSNRRSLMLNLTQDDDMTTLIFELQKEPQNTSHTIATRLYKDYHYAWYNWSEYPEYKYDLVSGSFSGYTDSLDFDSKYTIRKREYSSTANKYNSYSTTYTAAYYTPSSPTWFYMENIILYDGVSHEVIYSGPIIIAWERNYQQSDSNDYSKYQAIGLTPDGRIYNMYYMLSQNNKYLRGDTIHGVYNEAGGTYYITCQYTSSDNEKTYTFLPSAEEIQQ